MVEQAGQRRSRRARRNGSDAVTAHDVAQRAGVSVASVSRVLNGLAGVGVAVRQRVEEAAAELGYIPHAAARALASQRTRIVGAVVPTLENATFAVAVEALQQRLSAGGYTLLLASSRYDLASEAQQVRALVAQGVDAVVLVGGQHDPEMLQFLAMKGISYVETWILDAGKPCVGFDNAAIGRQIADYLLDLGHVDIGVIAGVTRNNDRAATRVQGVREAMFLRGLRLSKERLIERPYKIVEGQLGLRALMVQPPWPTAVICGNDLLAFGALTECEKLGLEVPADVSIAGIDDMEFAARLHPPLTTVRVPADEIGERAADYLLAHLAGQSVAAQTEIGVSLIVRGTTAAPARAESRKQPTKGLE